MAMANDGGAGRRRRHHSRRVSQIGFRFILVWREGDDRDKKSVGAIVRESKNTFLRSIAKEGGWPGNTPIASRLPRGKSQIRTVTIALLRHLLMKQAGLLTRQ